MTDVRLDSTEAARIARLLAELGDTADKVACSLRKKGFRGVRNTVRILNPIVRFAQSVVRTAAVGINVVTGETLQITYFNADRQEEAALPQPVIDFLRAFNQGAYPDLDVPAERV